MIKRGLLVSAPALTIMLTVIFLTYNRLMLVANTITNYIRDLALIPEAWRSLWNQVINFVLNSFFIALGISFAIAYFLFMCIYYDALSRTGRTPQGRVEVLVMPLVFTFAIYPVGLTVMAIGSWIVFKIIRDLFLLLLVLTILLSLVIPIVGGAILRFVAERDFGQSIIVVLRVFFMPLADGIFSAAISLLVDFAITISGIFVLCCIIQVMSLATCMRVAMALFVLIGIIALYDTICHRGSWLYQAAFYLVKQSIWATLLITIFLVSLWYSFPSITRSLTDLLSSILLVVIGKEISYLSILYCAIEAFVICALVYVLTRETTEEGSINSISISITLSIVFLLPLALSYVTQILIQQLPVLSSLADLLMAFLGEMIVFEYIVLTIMMTFLAPLLYLIVLWVSRILSLLHFFILRSSRSRYHVKYSSLAERSSYLLQDGPSEIEFMKRFPYSFCSLFSRLVSSWVFTVMVRCDVFSR